MHRRAGGRCCALKSSLVMLIALALSIPLAIIVRFALSDDRGGFRSIAFVGLPLHANGEPPPPPPLPLPCMLCFFTQPCRGGQRQMERAIQSAGAPLYSTPNRSVKFYKRPICSLRSLRSLGYGRFGQCGEIQWRKISLKTASQSM